MGISSCCCDPVLGSRRLSRSILSHAAHDEKVGRMSARKSMAIYEKPAGRSSRKGSPLFMADAQGSIQPH